MHRCDPCSGFFGKDKSAMSIEKINRQLWTPTTKIQELDMRVDSKTITSAQLLALNATPQTIVTAPGANKAVIFEGAMIHKPAGTAYAGIAAGEDLSFKYTGAGGIEVGQVETTGFLDQATAQTRWARPHHGASGPNDITPVANAPLVLHLLVGEITTGDSNLVLRIFYRILPTVLT